MAFADMTPRQRAERLIADCEIGPNCNICRTLRDLLGEAVGEAPRPQAGEPPNSLQALVNEQAEDDGLWFKAERITEAYLQEALRKLHTAIEADTARAGEPPQAPASLYDADIPLEVRREAMQCAVANGRISYHWLCDLFRRGRAAGRAGEPELRALIRLAREATNGWACYAKRKIEHDEIARLHAAISDIEALLRGASPQPTEEPER